MYQRIIEEQIQKNYFPGKLFVFLDLEDREKQLWLKNISGFWRRWLLHEL